MRNIAPPENGHKVATLAPAFQLEASGNLETALLKLLNIESVFSRIS